MKEHYPEAKVITADAGYKMPWICKRIIDDIDIIEDEARSAIYQ